MVTTKVVNLFGAVSSPDPGFRDASGMLRTGATVAIRVATSEDIAGLELMHEHMSADSLRHRFFGTGRGLARRYLEHLEHASDTIALVAVAGQRICGLGTAEPLGNARAEVAFVVDEKSRGLGIGTLLLERIAREAAARGIRELVAEVMAENHEMLEVFRDAGFPTASHRVGDTVTVVMQTEAHAVSGGPDVNGTSGPAQPPGSPLK